MTESRWMKNLVVTGGASGLGKAIIKEALLMGQFETVTNIDLQKYDGSMPGKVENIICDLSDPTHIWSAIPEDLPCDVLINNAGINHIDWFEDLSWAAYDRVMDINARAPWVLSKHLLWEIERKNGTILNIVSNASHVPMTSSLVYNASKAALHMITKQMAHELTKRKSVTVFGVSPAKVSGTGMSNYIEEAVPKNRGWTPEFSRQYQRDGLITGEEINPRVLAEFIGFLIANKERHFHLSGCVIPYGL